MRSAIGRGAAIAALVCALVIIVENVVTSVALPKTPARLATDFSTTFVEREMHAASRAEPQIVFLGDSVLWGYRLAATDGAVSLLRARGLPCLNLAFKKGSPPNYAALARLMQRDGVKPALVVLEIDQKVFNAVDDSYAALHPALVPLAADLFAPSDLGLLAKPQTQAEPMRTTDAVLDALWLPYAMRSDIRELVAGDDVAVPPAPTADELDSTYDLSPLTPQNVGVHFLLETADVFHSAHVPVVAFFTPTNHGLVGEYIDNPQYRARAAYLRRGLEAREVRVFDFDRAVPTSEFFDEVHLTVRGQHRLAALLAPTIATSGSHG